MKKMINLFSKKEIEKTIIVRVFYGSGEKPWGLGNWKHGFEDFKNIKERYVLPIQLSKKIFSTSFNSESELYKLYMKYPKTIQYKEGNIQLAGKVDGFKWFFPLFNFLTACQKHFNSEISEAEYTYAAKDELIHPIAYLVAYCWNRVFQESCEITVHLKSKSKLYDFVKDGELNSYNLMKSIGDVDLYYYFNNSSELLSFTLGNFKNKLKEAEKKFDYKKFI